MSMQTLRPHWRKTTPTLVQQVATLCLPVAMVMVALALVLSLSGCGTQPTRYVVAKPPRPDAALLVRHALDVPPLVDPITEQSVLLKHADEMAERHTLAAQLNELIDWVEKVTE